MTEKPNNIFLSHSNEDVFEASLLQHALEFSMYDLGAKVWAYGRDQDKYERNVANSLKKRIEKSIATIFLISPSTLDGGATQWMEFAYSDAFGIPIFVLLHHLTYDELKNKETNIPPLLLSGQCNQAIEWKLIETDLRKIIGENNA